MGPISRRVSQRQLPKCRSPEYARRWTSVLREFSPAIPISPSCSHLFSIGTRASAEVMLAIDAINGKRATRFREFLQPKRTRLPRLNRIHQTSVGGRPVRRRSALVTSAASCRLSWSSESPNVTPCTQVGPKRRLLLAGEEAACHHRQQL